MRKEPSDADLFRDAVIKTQKQKMGQVRRAWAGDAAAYQSRHFEHAGTTTGDPEADMLVVENNWLFAFIDTMVANICPPNPAVSILPRREDLKEAGKLRQALINDLFKREKFHAKLWKAVIRASVFPRSFLKVVWNNQRQRPTIRVLSPQFVFFDNTVEEWEDIRYIAEVTVLTETEFDQRIGKKGKKGPTYRTNAKDHAKFQPYPAWLLKEDSLAENVEHAAAAQAMKWVVVYEFYDFVERKFLHIVEGDPVPVFESEFPYWFLPNPYQILTFNDNLEDIGGLSDAQLVRPSVTALNEMSTLQLAYAQASIPKTIVQENLLDDPDAFVGALETANGPNDIIRMSAKANVAAEQVITRTPTPSMPFEFQASINGLRELIEFILGIASYQRGGLGQSDVATELALSDTAIRTRNSRRQKAVYDLVSWTARAITDLYTQFMKEDSEIPLRLGHGSHTLVTREILHLLPLPTEDDEDVVMPEDSLSFDYEAQPFNAQEGNSVVQLKTLIEMLNVLLGSPFVDQYALMEKLLELQHMTQLLRDKEEVEQEQEAAAQAAAEAEGGGGDMDADVSPEVAETLAGNVPAGDGEQTVPSGMMGGFQPGGG